MHTSEPIGQGQPASASASCCGGGSCGSAAQSTPQPAASSCCGGSASSSASGGCCGGGGCGSESQANPTSDVLVFSRDQIREVDRLAIDEFAIPGLLLMENAARGVAGVIVQGLEGLSSPTVVLFCGPGNNGGDGLAVARHLSNRNMKVGIILGAAADRYTGDAAANLEICRRMGLPIVQAHADPDRAVDQMFALMGQPEVVVDALLGTGATQPARGPIGALITRLNAAKAAGSTVVSIDLPSGMDAQTGLPCTAEADQTPGPCVSADLTVTLAGLKHGFLNDAAQSFIGQMVIVDIGAPEALLRRLGTPLSELKAQPAS